MTSLKRLHCLTHGSLRGPGLIAISIVLLLSLLPIPAQSMEREFHADYRAYYGAVRGAATRFSLERGENDEWTWRSFTEPAGMVGMFRDDEIDERSRFRIREGELIPRDYRYRHTEDGELQRKREIRFDWDRNRAWYDDDGDTGELEVEDGTLDRFLTQLALMRDLSRDERRDEYTVVARDEVIRQEVVYAGEERMRVRAGRFDTLRVELHDADSERKLVVWLTPELDYLAVRLEQREPGERTIRMDLDDWDGL